MCQLYHTRVFSGFKLKTVKNGKKRENFGKLKQSELTFDLGYCLNVVIDLT